ncbi:hypothetical protein OXPF_01730 [Oxobacter pfennigii]|uniref:SipL SPOCS domain-containing protein n=1 Tax=Oxobacter pfennigii TaxID=36849 RepID=A0A0P8Z276_9CLOT|nr:hypothetical protein [Oxobacter pfennigii]KPU46254.1 hypothetical protein OXPF_01730 [Oxobacter pfennigii]
MRLDDYLVNSMANNGNVQQAGAAGSNCCTTNNDVLGANIGGLGADCCPTNGNGNGVLGVSAGNGVRTIEVPEVLGIGDGRAFVEVCIPVVPPGFSILFDLIERRLVFDALVAARGKVFINGRLIKKIPFEVCDRSVIPTSGNISRITLSNLRAITVEVPFAMCIDLPESIRGARVVVLNTNVDSVELPNLRCPELACIRSIVEKDCIDVQVKVERDVIINVPTTGTGNGTF